MAFINNTVFDFLTGCSGELVPVNGDKLGWKPKWDSEEKFLDLIDQEIDDILKLDTAGTSLFNDLLKQ